MRFIRKLLSVVWKMMAWGCSLVFGILFVFLVGYWMGWKTTSVKQRIAELSAVPPSGANGISRQSFGMTGPGAGEVEMGVARERVTRLARSLVASSDSRAASIGATAEIASLGLEDVYATLLVLKTAPNSAAFDSLRVLLLQRLTTLNPQAALAYAQNEFKDTTGPTGRGAMMSVVFQRWAFSDPVGALQAWRVATMGGSPDVNSARLKDESLGLGAIMQYYGRKDLKAAMAEIPTLSSARQSDAWFALSVLAGQEEPRNQLLAAITAMPTGPARTKALAEMLDIWARNPSQQQTILQWIDSAGLTRAETALAEERMAGSFYENRKEKSDWLIARSQSPEERSTRLANIVLNWAFEDPVAAGEWLKSQTLDATASSAMGRYAETIAPRYPEAAVEWVRNIPDPAAKQRAVANLERRIRQHFPHRADELLKPVQHL